MLTLGHKLCGFLLLFVATSFAESTTTRTVEVSVVTDWETVSHYTSIDEIESIISSTFLYANNIFSNQMDISLKVTHIDIPETEAEDTIANHTHVSFLINSLIDYRNENPNHYNADVTVMLTKRDLTLGTRNLLGFGMTRRMCSASSAALVELTDNGLDGQTLAHELGHVLGAVHDGIEPCENISTRGYLMAPLIRNGSDFLSQCSIDTINSVVEIYSNCLLEDNTTPVELTPITDQPFERKGGRGSIDITFLLMLLIMAVIIKARK